MSFLREVDVPERFEPFVALRQGLGFVPNLFRAQTLLPRAIEAESLIAGVVLFKDGALSRIQKESLLLSVAAEKDNLYCVTVHWNLLRGQGVPDATLECLVNELPDEDVPAVDGRLSKILRFGRKLATRPEEMGLSDFEALREADFSDEAILEAVLTTSLVQFLCTLSVGLGAVPDFEAQTIPSRVQRSRGTPRHAASAPGRKGPYLRTVDRSAETFPPFAFFRKRFGFVPNIFRAQTLKPEVVEAETRIIDTVLLTEDVLSRVQKEYILLVVSAANLNTYCVAVHCELLRGLGIPPLLSDQIALDHREAGVSQKDAALLDFALKLAKLPADYGVADVELLRGQGFSDTQILECVVMTSLSGFLNTLQTGLGTVPDFEPRVVLQKRDPPVAPASRMEAARASAEDDERDLVVRAQAGEAGAFEELVHRHARCVYRAVIGITGDRAEAEDEVQNTFLKAFQHLQDFQGGSRFSTWLTRIAINEALDRHRRFGRLVSWDVAGPEEIEERFSPRNVRPWVEDPEQACSRKETRDLVEREIMKLPAKYRLPVLLRDIEQLSGVEAAEMLGLSLPTMKTRLLRGRMMLREALARHFAPEGRLHA